MFGEAPSDGRECGSASGLQPTEAGSHDSTANRASLGACSWLYLVSVTYVELQRMNWICPSTVN